MERRKDEDGVKKKRKKKVRKLWLLLGGKTDIHREIHTFFFSPEQPADIYSHEVCTFHNTISVE